MLREMLRHNRDLPRYHTEQAQWSSSTAAIQAGKTNDWGTELDRKRGMTGKGGWSLIPLPYSSLTGLLCCVVL